MWEIILITNDNIDIISMPWNVVYGDLPISMETPYAVRSLHSPHTHTHTRIERSKKLWIISNNKFISCSRHRNILHTFFCNYTVVFFFWKAFRLPNGRIVFPIKTIVMIFYFCWFFIWILTQSTLCAPSEFIGFA